MKNIIIGGGAAGLFTAARLDAGHETLLLDKNERLGKKLYITGKGRCNLTNAAVGEEFMENILGSRRFFYSAFDRFNNYDMYAFMEDEGVRLKIERGQRVFPESDRAQDVINALERAARRQRTVIRKNTCASGLLFNEDGSSVIGVTLDDKSRILADNVIIATGGLSYPTTGSTGDGYRLARSAGHTIEKCYPSLVPFLIKENFCREMAGLSLKNVRALINKNGRELWSGFGEILFTHSGVSGPLILTASACAGSAVAGAMLSIDLKPALDEKMLDDRLVKEFAESPRKSLRSALRGLLPASMVPVFEKRLGGGDITLGSVTRELRERLIHLLKSFDMTIEGLAGYNEAVVTKGGVRTKEIDPRTMGSKLCKGLYFTGEVMDLDALTGGFNLQIAWSTAAACAAAINDQKRGK